MKDCRHSDCLYRSVKCDCCVYILIMGSRRPGPAKDCPVYEPRNGRRGFLKNTRSLTKQEQEDELFDCYFVGMPDKQIAEEVGVSVRRVVNWRRDNQLPANVRRLEDEFDDNGLPEQEDTEGQRAEPDMGGTG